MSWKFIIKSNKEKIEVLSHLHVIKSNFKFNCGAAYSSKKHLSNYYNFLHYHNYNCFAFLYVALYQIESRNKEQTFENISNEKLHFKMELCCLVKSKI